MFGRLKVVQENIKGGTERVMGGQLGEEVRNQYSLLKKIKKENKIQV